MAELRTKRGDVILVDDEDFMALSKPSWHVTSDGYAKRTVRIGRHSEEMLHGEFANAGN